MVCPFCDILKTNSQILYTDHDSLVKWKTLLEAGGCAYEKENNSNVFTDIFLVDDEYRAADE